MTDDYIMKCPLCKIETKYIVRHIGHDKNCKRYFNQDDFKLKFRLYKLNKDEDKIKADQRNRKAISIAKQRRK